MVIGEGIGLSIADIILFLLLFFFFGENASLCLSFGCFMIKIGTILLSTGLHDKHIKVLNICFNINLGPAANGRNH